MWQEARWRPPAGPAAVLLVVAVLLATGVGARAVHGADGDGDVRVVAGAPPVTTAPTTGSPAALPTETTAPDLTGVSGAAGAAGASGAAGGQVVVDVVGRVRSPGVVRLPPGSRVSDAVEAAGGVASGAAIELLNLARTLVDGEQIVVPRPGETAAPAAAPEATSSVAGSAPAAGAGSAGVPLDLNSATESELDALPGIGPVLAGRIVAWRTENGRFASVDDLGEVEGIGDTVLGRLRPLVRV